MTNNDTPLDRLIAALEKNYLSLETDLNKKRTARQVADQAFDAALVKDLTSDILGLEGQLKGLDSALTLARAIQEGY